MENFSTPPQSSFGAPPQPPAKKGLSKSCIFGIVAAVVVAVGGVILVAAGVGGYYLLRRDGPQTTGTKTGVSVGPVKSTSSSSPSKATGDAEAPSPTEAQRAAVAGGQSAVWAQQEISWTVPQRWARNSESSTSLLWRSPGSWDAANLIVSVSPMDASFPVDASINAFYEQAQTRKSHGEVNEVRWLMLDGLKGVMFREASPEGDDDPQRLQWMGYRNYKGQVQLVNIMLAARGKDFARHEDALYGVLYSTDFTP